MLLAVTCVTFLVGCVTGDLDLHILHNNDIHSHFNPVSASTGACKNQGQCYGGTARLVHAVKTFKEAVPNTLVLYGGDIFQGTAYYTFFRWRAAADMMNLVPYDAMALGNHEFDDSVPGLLPYIANVSHPMLCTNIDFGPWSSPVTARCRSSIVVEVDGYKVGIMGYITTDTPDIAPVPAGVVFEDEIEALQNETSRLQDLGAQIIIAVGHSGYVREKQMAESIDGIDIIVGGHSHSFLYTGTPPAEDAGLVEGPYPTVVTQRSGRTVLVVQAYQYGKYLGQLNVTFDNQGEVKSWSGKPILLNGDMDQTTVEKLEVYAQKIRLEEAKVVGVTHVNLVGDRSVCRRAECNLGNLITDAMLRATVSPKNNSWSQVSAAICQGGGIRDSVEVGNITQVDIQNILPFGNTVDIVTLTGKDLFAVFEHSASAVEELKGRFLQVSGIQVVFDMAQSVGSRVVSLKIYCSDCLVPKLEPVVTTRTYKIALLTFLANGGDGYSIINNNKLSHDIGRLDTEVLRDHVIRMSPIITGLQERIQFVVPSADIFS